MILRFPTWTPRYEAISGVHPKIRHKKSNLFQESEKYWDDPKAKIRMKNSAKNKMLKAISKISITKSSEVDVGLLQASTIL